ncbi:B-type cyclin CLB3 Ecym_8082 [Eremothecium cymbalariae DBVPG|uniref:Uncharacterized protein n=1 Tax=Eremothecium cymbalariae (strain CBS 270.75 / DBVPG 7215 / KCTC 17166 / NRRL Y-17582) TaxID=931890 RepID=G8JX03_ERECY|nr:Hypothetical protein Ecym_8082 [Eremothecium cymbalariae DBVPG\
MYNTSTTNENSSSFQRSLKAVTSGHQSNAMNLSSHRVALSDVTSQVNNRHNRNSSVYKQDIGLHRKSGVVSHVHTSSFDSTNIVVQNSSESEEFSTEDREHHSGGEEEYGVIQGSGEFYLSTSVRSADNVISLNDAEEYGLTQPKVIGDDSMDEEQQLESLLPTTNSEIEMFIEEVTEQFHREIPDPLDEDTWDAVMVAEYAPEIFRYLRSLEAKYTPHAKYMNFQPELKWSYRSTLIDWIVQVHCRFQLLPETLYLTVNIIDRFLSKKTITLNRFQLVGAAALFIASKYEEINCPTLNEMLYMLDNAYSGEEVLKAERYMIDTLEFEFSWPGPMSFLRRVSKADNYEYDIRTLAKYLLETSIMDSRMVAAPPSWLAAGAYYLSRIIIGHNTWNKQHIFYSGYTSEQLVPLATAILENCRHADSRHHAIFEKYSKSRHRRSAQVVARWIAMAEESIHET